MTEDEKFELILDIPVEIHLKEDDKKDLVELIKTNLLENGATSVSIEDDFYVEKRSVEFLSSLHLAFEVLSPYATVASLALAIFALKKSDKGKITLKKKNGDTVVIKEEMSEDEIKRKLDE